jgi:hypothetical protein
MSLKNFHTNCLAPVEELREKDAHLLFESDLKLEESWTEDHAENHVVLGQESSKKDGDTPVESDLGLEWKGAQGLSSLNPSTQVTAQSWRPRFGPELPAKAETSKRPFTSEASTAVLEEISQESRERKAVKPDDADVPEYLWESHLLEEVEGEDWDEETLKKVRRLTEWLRSKMLRWWKRKGTSSYVSWMKEKYEIKDSEKIQEWMTRKWTCFKNGREGVEYQWTEEGELEYKRCWKQQFLRTAQDFTPGVMLSEELLRRPGGVGTPALAHFTRDGRRSIKKSFEMGCRSTFKVNLPSFCLPNQGQGD